jgi:DMSO/TMAO reductase YedYZ molybdopterin-dependent catalytic subunit
VLGALVGVLAAFVALGAGEFAAAFVRPAAAPIIAVGNRVITLTPESTKRSAIQSFGTDDKTVLLLTLFAAVAVFGAVVGTFALSNVWYGLAGVVAFGAFGVYCSLTQNAAHGTDAIPSIVATVVGAAALWVLMRLLGPEPGQSARAGSDRRGFLIGTAATAGLAAISGFGGRAAIRARFDVATQRKAVALPTPTSSAPAIARGTDLGKSGVAFVTSADRFYKIDTTLEPPQVDPNDWSLRIHGMVDHEITLSYSDLLARPLVERWITLCCVSNEVGGNLISNARWLGVRLADVLRAAGVHDGADQLLMTSVEGMTIGAPTKVVMDGRDALIAVGMNGEPLPVAHGFPARIVVPGLYGYVSACKWVTDIEATTFSARQAYWVQGGWTSGAQQDYIKLESRIDTPRPSDTVRAGTAVAIAGVAWDQHVGVSKVEVQVGSGPWQAARLAGVPSTDTWRQWVLPWTPPRAGVYTLRVRATDATGRTQTGQRQAVYPSGATGWHQITVRAS